MNKIVYESEYGWNEVGRCERGEGKQWHRYDTYTAKRDGEKYVEMRFAAGPDDVSNQIGQEHYRAECPSCWLHFSHTIDRHNQFVRRESK